MEIVDLGNYPEIYADGVAEVQNLGVNVRLMFFTWRRSGGVYIRSICAAMIRPTTSLMMGTGLVQRALLDMPPAAPMERSGAH